MKHAFILTLLLLSACEGTHNYNDIYQATDKNQTFEQRTTDAINGCENLGCRNM